MAKFSMTSFALKWFYLCCPGSVIVYSEFSHLFMKQLGFNPWQIGLTSLIGIQHFFIPLFLLLGDKFRARKTVATITSVGIVITSFVPLLALLVPLPTCFTATQHMNHSNVVITSEFRLSNASLHSRGLQNLGNNRMWKSQYSLQLKTTTNQYHVPWLSNLFFVMVASKSLNVLFQCLLLPLGNLATITYLKDQRASYGAYLMWSNVSGAVSIFIVAVLAWNIRIHICGIEDYGYFTVYIIAGCMSLLSLFSLPWFKFEYDENITINWSEVKSSLFNVHYTFIFVVVFYGGLCLSFQVYWEFWYLDGLSASPLIMGGAALIRRPLIAVSNLASGHLLRTIGELKTVCVVFLLYAISYLALSFTRLPWLVLGIDVFQAAANGLAYCAFTVHFSKLAGFKKNSGVILGILETVYAVGFDAGSTLMGVLFGVLGTQLTLLFYSISSSVMLIILLLYIHFSKYVHVYEKLAQESDEE